MISHPPLTSGQKPNSLAGMSCCLYTGDRIWSCNNLFSSLSNQHTTASLLYKAAELIVPLPFPRVKKLEDSVTSSPARILVPCMDHVETPVTYFYYLVFSDNMDHVETPATATLEVMLRRLRLPYP